MNKKDRKKKKVPCSYQCHRELEDLMLGRVVNPKYVYPGIPIVDVYISGTLISKIVIELRASINVMNQDTMIKIDIQNMLRQTTIVLQLVDTSTVCPDGILESIMVTIDTWWYPKYFIFIHTKSKLSG